MITTVFKFDLKISKKKKKSNVSSVLYVKPFNFEPARRGTSRRIHSVKHDYNKLLLLKQSILLYLLHVIVSLDLTVVFRPRNSNPKSLALVSKLFRYSINVETERQASHEFVQSCTEIYFRTL